MYQCTKKNKQTILFKVEWITEKTFFVRSQVISKKYL